MEVVVQSLTQSVTRVLEEKVEDMPDMPDIPSIVGAAVRGPEDGVGMSPIGELDMPMSMFIASSGGCL